MDVKALQHQLRAFAAARDWQPYHAPKNLAMALMVEAAELLELFQWHTLTESRGFTRDPQNRERVADELADVLLYLLQMADHTGVDLEQAVAAKLVKNAAKHPSKSAVADPLPVAPAAPAAGKVHLLVDWENVQPDGAALQALQPRGSNVWLFHGPQQRVDASSHVAAYGADGVTQVPRSGAGRNALDFQLSYYVGYISARQPEAAFVVVSNDQGYDPMLAHARELGFDARRVEYRKPVAAIAPRTADSQTAPVPVTAAAKATRQEVQALARLLAELPESRRPASKAALLDWLQDHLRELGQVSPRVEHALAQLRAQKQVVLKGAVASYPVAPALAAPKASPKPTPKASPKPAAPPPARKKAATPSAAQVAQAVLASLRKMPKNKPTRPAGLLRFIETHAAKAPAPQALAQQVYVLLQARQQVVVTPDGKGIRYPEIKAKKAGSD
ncbi:MAG: nucleotide pyrophosphohydrolase [Proteobacteria bacterium]|nr:nucleotide pyrophosphohydrolase [Pseudomonadota bacterium]